jgi:uroporphyrinogen-III decarboxylase
MFKLIRARGSFACLHICGEIANLTPHLSKLKIDLLSFEDASILSQWRLLPETIPMGYVSTSVFLGADKERVRSATEECRLKMPKPMALSSGCDLPAKANPALVKVFMNYGMAEYNGNIKF